MHPVPVGAHMSGLRETRLAASASPGAHSSLSCLWGSDGGWGPRTCVQHPRSTTSWVGSQRAEASVLTLGKSRPRPHTPTCPPHSPGAAQGTGEYDEEGKVGCNSLLRVRQGGSGQWLWEADLGVVARGRTRRPPTQVGQARPPSREDTRLVTVIHSQKNERRKVLFSGKVAKNTHL